MNGKRVYKSDFANNTGLFSPSTQQRKTPYMFPNYGREYRREVNDCRLCVVAISLNPRFETGSGGYMFHNES
jgi:hypothetical protein